MTAVTHNDDLYYYVLFALLQIGNPQDYEKKINPGPKLSLLRLHKLCRVGSIFIILRASYYEEDVVSTILASTEDL
jgi:hypothetical protein